MGLGVGGVADDGAVVEVDDVFADVGGAVCDAFDCVRNGGDIVGVGGKTVILLQDAFDKTIHFAVQLINRIIFENDHPCEGGIAINQGLNRIAHHLLHLIQHRRKVDLARRRGLVPGDHKDAFGDIGGQIRNTLHLTIHLQNRDEQP